MGQEPESNRCSKPRNARKISSPIPEISLKNVRADLIRQLFYSPVYSRLISNILCNGIKEYLLVENFVVHNISRFFSLIYFGQTTFNTVMTPVESYIEKQVKKYIDLNIDNIVSYSEKYLVKFLNENQILEIADEIWKSLAPCPLTDYFKQIDGNDMEDFIIIGHEFWLHFRQTNYFKEIYEELVYYFFEKYGDQRLDIIVEDLGVSKELIINEVVEIVSPGFEKALEIGYLEDRIRARLASFYSSDLMQDHFDRIQKKQGRA
ncbi:MAG: hypothetical protein OMM_00078 [Candidatus Magnetoglobus multicellularis str. Araruama]|uniref:Uncharacterized protein n=1 Tax=Candidatus Magnetoglobus multicellularis str. Araruama TaxID=890399 RepID=A0A1V1PI39_9BACT|nr:MAG: hypothetical protein OMM_00078 [Candidatus Magnetoglobus multicellularis str. Araruama]